MIRNNETYTLVDGNEGDDTFIFNTQEQAQVVIRAGLGDDTFSFNDVTSLQDQQTIIEGEWTAIATLLDGQGGNDTIDFAAYTTSIEVYLSSGIASNIAGGLADHLMNIENIVGGSGDDILEGDSGDNVIVGNGGDDILRGLLGNDTYVFTNGWGSDQVFEEDSQGNDTITFGGYEALGVDAASVVIKFNIYDDSLFISDDTFTIDYVGTAIENLTGGDANDQFIFHASGVVNGMVDGGSGSDMLDLSDRATVSHVYLTAFGDIDGFSGYEYPYDVDFTNIDQALGSALSGDEITSMDEASTYTIYNETGQNVVQTGVVSLLFSGFEYVSGGGADDQFNFVEENNEILEYRGGAGDDTFALIGDVIVDGKINGQGGDDTLDYSAYNSGVTVDLEAGTATGITGILASIETVIGSAFDDILIGNIWDNSLYGEGGNDLLIGAAGDDLLDGGEGNDIFRFLLDWGNDIINDLSGMMDEVDFSQISFALTFTISISGLVVNGNGNLLTTLEKQYRSTQGRHGR